MNAFHFIHCTIITSLIYTHAGEAGPAGSGFNKSREAVRVPAESEEAVMTRLSNQAVQQNSWINDYVAGALMAAVLLLSGLLSLSQFAI